MTRSLKASENDVMTSYRWKMVWACALFVTSLAKAELAPTLGTLTLPPGSTQVSLGERMRLFGMPIDIRVFEIPAPIDRAAQRLMQWYTGLSDIGVYPGRLVLSGEVDQQFWVVSLIPAGPEATRGTASVSRSTAQGSRPVPGAASDATMPVLDAVADDRHAMVSHTWLPRMAGLKLQLEQDADDGTGGRTLQQVWTIPSSVGWTRRAIRRNLLRDQWRLQSETQDTSQWQRNQISIQLTIAPVDSGTGLLLLQHDGAAS